MKAAWFERQGPAREVLEAKTRAARELSESLAEGWRPFGNFDAFPLAAIAEAHEQVERGQPNGKVVVMVAE